LDEAIKMRYIIVCKVIKIDVTRKSLETRALPSRLQLQHPQSALNGLVTCNVSQISSYPANRFSLITRFFREGLFISLSKPFPMDSVLRFPEAQGPPEDDLRTSPPAKRNKQRMKSLPQPWTSPDKLQHVSLPVVADVTTATIMKNYDKIVKDVNGLVEEEMKRIITPELRRFIVKK
jgi:hypothetical protein